MEYIPHKFKIGQTVHWRSITGKVWHFVVKNYELVSVGYYYTLHHAPTNWTLNLTEDALMGGNALERLKERYA